MRLFIKKWNSDIYEHRVKYFFLSLLFTAVAIGFLLVGIYMQSGWGSPVHRIIEIVVAGIFLLIGFATAVNYLVIIIRGKK
ncbi:MAG: hypothetical protein Q7S89_02955 [bacterium]|nr:hypothetical protein [bacterium]